MDLGGRLLVFWGVLMLKIDSGSETPSIYAASVALIVIATCIESVCVFVWQLWSEDMFAYLNFTNALFPVSLRVPRVKRMFYFYGCNQCRSNASCNESALPKIRYRTIISTAIWAVSIIRCRYI